MRKRRWYKIGRLSAAAVALTLITQQPSSRPAGAAAPQTWVVTTGTVKVVSAAAPGLATRLFGSSWAIVLGLPDTGQPTSLSWASEAAFELAVSNGWIPPGVTTVMYDPENWPSTPAPERIDPVTAMRAFSTTARGQGYRVVLTPHPSLVTVPGGRCTVGPGESIEDAYVRCDIAGQAATMADVVETQAQALETDPSAYRSFVEATAEQARAANPDVSVLAGLSTNYTDSPVALYSAWYAVRDVVDGHYLAVPHGIRPGVAIAFLRLLPR